METSSSGFFFPTEIALSKNPLLEAWLEIRWALSSSNKDEGYPFALGVFYSSILDDFPLRETLPQNLAPEEVFPHLVRFQFKIKEDEWPVLQLGPGIATVNFTTPYTWEDFKSKSLYLREKLIGAYSAGNLQISNLILRYRNAVMFDYLSSDLFDFLKHNLNVSITPPVHIPGHQAESAWPKDLNIHLTYDLSQPVGKGSVRFVTARKLNDDDNTLQPAIVFDLIVESLTEGGTYWASVEDFDNWLTSAHNVIHEWFFSLIDGRLRRQYESKG